MQHVVVGLGGQTTHEVELHAAPTGVASEAEYLEIGLQTAVDPADLMRALDAGLSPGLDILD
ncbi:MAG TPA: DUF2344 domain-containing protein, partial [Actinoplanes sp.]|nr:DUF2344 domain-containing protein [Actinoplanes sp.]